MKVTKVPSAIYAERPPGVGESKTEQDQLLETREP